jgi:adenine-specific DNA-methyltransferase
LQYYEISSAGLSGEGMSQSEANATITESLPILPSGAKSYPQLRFMGSKHRLLPWIHEVLRAHSFQTALDPFSGSGAVAYLLKSMGKTVMTSDFLNFCATIAHATVENSTTRLSENDMQILLRPTRVGDRRTFIHDTFREIFFTESDLSFLDSVWCNLSNLKTPYHHSLALSALIRSCVKRQPRGVFTVAGDSLRYDDGRRDLRLSLEEHFREQVAVYNAAVFDNGRECRAIRSDVFELPSAYRDVDLVYLDPPYVPRSDDNCYVKRYHFLEGLSTYWENQEILFETKVKKIRKKYTPFSYRKDALTAFERLFDMFGRSTIVLSYSSNGYPDLDALVQLLKRTKATVEVYKRNHRYHFGTHSKVRRAEVLEYLIVGTG